jgi:hypothetical protein
MQRSRALGTNPNKADTDGDGLNHAEEYNPLLKDTNGHGYDDKTEIQAGSDPLDSTSKP